jgi:hypothetical protein
MAKRVLGRTLIVAMAATAVAAFAQPAGAAAAVTFNCDASALRATLLTLPPIEPITANRGAAICQAASGILAQLPAPLTLNAAVAQTSVTPDGREADATGGVANLAVAPLGIPSNLLPSQQAVDSLPAVSVPLPALPLAGLPASITVDLRPAVKALLAALPTADLIDLKVATAYARAVCTNGAPQLQGASQALGLSVLGQQLPTDQALSQALTLLQTQNIDPKNLDLSKIVLPAGLSFTQPGIGTLLQTAVKAVLAGLPPIQIPASVAEVRVTPNEQINQAGELTQRALHIVMTLAGQNLVDVVLGEAHVSDHSAICSQPQPPAASLALQCTKRKLTLIDVLQHGDHVYLVGAADRSLVGKRVDIFIHATGKQVASAVVGADRFFRTTAPLPAAAIRETNLARYEARAGGERSLDLKLRRRMVVNSMRSSNHQVTITGQVVEPLANPTKTIVIQRRVSCTQLVTVKRVVPGRDGKFSVTLPAPPGQQAAVYRATTEVRKNTTNPKLFPTFTLPRVVELR